MRASELTPDDIAARLHELELPVFTGELDPTLVTIRAHRRDGDEFDDVFAALWHERGMLHGILGQGTCDPGRSTRENPANRRGAPVVLPGWHRGCWGFGPEYHGARAHPYLCGRQIGPIRYIRDADRDAVVDLGTTGWARNAVEFASLLQAITLGREVHEDIIFIDMHRASSRRVVEEIGPWGAGCQVWQRDDDFDDVMALMDRVRAARRGKTHSLILVDEWGMSR